MKDLLLLSLRFPYPPHRGDRIRTYYFLRGLAERFRVSLVTFYEDPAELKGERALREFCDRIWPVPISKWEQRRYGALHLFSRMPIQNGVWYSPRMARTIREALDQVKPDVVQAELFRMGRYVVDLTTPKLLDLVDAMGMNLRRRRAYEQSPLNRALLRLEERRVRRYERTIARRFDRVTVISPVDQAAIHEEIPDVGVEVISNGVDLDYFNPASIPKKGDRRPTLLFTGTMDYFPNTDAAYYLATEILPRVQEEIPATRLCIVGTRPTRALRRLDGKNGIVVTGRVPDIRPYFAEADVFVAPLRCGSGLQNKNLEAMAMGVPVVTTPLGCQGMGATPGDDFLCDTHPGMLAHHVLCLLGDRDYHRSIAENGRAYVEREHHWKTMTERLGRILDELTTDRTASPAPTNETDASAATRLTREGA